MIFGLSCLYCLSCLFVPLAVFIILFGSEGRWRYLWILLMFVSLSAVIALEPFNIYCVMRERAESIEDTIYDLERCQIEESTLEFASDIERLKVRLNDARIEVNEYSKTLPFGVAELLPTE